MESFLKHQPKKVVKFIPYEKHSISLSNSTITKILDLKKAIKSLILTKG